MKSVAAAYDGQHYFFSSERQRAIFLAAPHRYVPVLGGRCVVSYAELGRKVAGDLRLGLLYQGRLYLFSSVARRRQFQAEPDKYRDADLANAGNCPVTQQQEQRRVAGIPATLHIDHGLRYLFANTAAKKIFLQAPNRYMQEKIHQVPDTQEMAREHKFHAERMPAINPLPTEETTEPSVPSESVADQSQAGTHHPARAKRLPDPIRNSPNRKYPEDESETLSQVDSELSDNKPAMGGYCPVSIHGDGQDWGVWVEGKKTFHAIYDGILYLFAGTREKTQFLADPEKYIPALGGDCVVCKRDLGKEVHGSIFHAAVYGGRLFLFADSEQKKQFKENPAAYDQVDLALDGMCVVTQREEGRQVDGDENYFAWYHNRRYLFASSAFRQKFIAAPEQYVVP